jgi:cardiolipin synthase
MKSKPWLKERDRSTRPAIRELADQAFSRAAGAPLIDGNRVTLLKDAAQNYPAWLKAIESAERYIHFESYIIHEDEQGWKFAEALIAKAKQGVRVRLVYDWMGGFGKTSRSFWNHLREHKVEVRCFNAPQWDSPLGWLSRDHRKTLTVDGRIGFITGLCVGRDWVGNPEKKIDPWRDTGVEVRGPAVADIEHGFAYIWNVIGEPLPKEEIADRDPDSPEGDMQLRVVATIPANAGMLRLDQMVAALARSRLWLTDAYYAGTTSYVQALRAAAMDDVDVRLLVPSATDIPILRPLSRSGYRTLLEAGVRIFEWNGSMLHAKTAVADGRWARVGSTNLNIASWFGNCEMDAVVEDERFGAEMEKMYLDDLTNATEVVLDERDRVRAPRRPRQSRFVASGGGSGGRAAAGALRIGNAVGAAFAGKRVLEPVEARLMMIGGTLMLGLAVLFFTFPRALVYPIVVILTWLSIALLYRGTKLFLVKEAPETEETPQDALQEPAKHEIPQQPVDGRMP